jgi:choline dehydrogenase
VFEGPRAVGVEVETDGRVEVVRGRTIVLSAGSLQSPAILMRSGIGPSEELARHGIELRSDSPAIGTRLSDHPALAVAATVKDASLIDGDHPIVQTILRYTAPDSDQRNDLQIEAFSYSQRPGPLRHIAVAAVLEQAYGTGTLRLASADPHAPPVVQQQFLEDERDLRRMVTCFRDTLKFVETGPLAGLVEDVVFPSPERELTDGTLRVLLKKLAASGFHPCATVPMGPDGAVDQYGRLHGAEGLVVADASIMPTVPRANTNLTSIMIGEMVGEWVRTRGGELYGL